MRNLIKNNNKIANSNTEKFDEKQNGKQAQASTLWQRAQIQIPTLTSLMTLLRIYLKLSVNLRQWWSSIMKISTQKSHANTRKYINKSWKLMTVMWNILDQFLCLCFLLIWMMSRKLDFYLHWCFIHTVFFFRFSFLYLNFLNRMFGFTISE